MKRRLRTVWTAVGLSALSAILIAPPGAGARAGRADLSRTMARGSVTGTVTTLSGRSLTIQTRGRRMGLVNVLTRAANRITRQAYPYVYGGGHEHAGTASVGIPGSGYNGRRRGFDCSGAVAAVLAAGGLWPAGSGVPNEAGMVVQLRSQHLIARGAGRGPVQVTIYEDPGVHTFMNIDGRFFGTSDGAGGGNRRGGAGWLDDGAPDATSHYYLRWHVLPSVLKASASSGHIVTFQAGALAESMNQLHSGEKVRVAYRETRSGNMIAVKVGFPGARHATGTVTALGAAGRSFTLQRRGGSDLSLSVAGNPSLLEAIAVGETVQVTYTRHGGRLIARLVSVSGGGNGWPGGPGGWGHGWPDR
ncbi:MAG: hypothetical protein ACJ764_08030 [Solirubrobacteraceae bacterium]